MQSRECCGRGSGVQRVPCRDEGRGQARGKLSGSLPAATPGTASSEPWWSPRLPAWGGVFGNPAANTNRRLRVPATFPSFPAPGKQRGCLGSPRRSRKLSPAWSLHPGARLPLTPRVSLCVCVCVGVWERPLCVCVSAGLLCPCLISV